MFFTSGGIGILKGKLLATACFILLYFFNAQAFQVTVDSTKASGNGNFRFLDSMLLAIGKTLSPASSGEDTVLFTDTVQRTYVLSVDMQGSSGSIRFLGVPADPLKFPIIKHTAGEWYNYFNTVNFACERLTFTGSTKFTTGNDAKKQTFSNCIFRDFSSSASSFLVVRGGGVQQTSFENCLVVDNEFSTSFVDNATYGSTDALAPIIQFINCTFDDNAHVFSCSDANSRVSSTTIKNCIFCANNNIYTGTPDLKSRITYSVVPDSTYSGIGNVTTYNPYFTKLSGKSSPSDWRPTDSSAARGIGDIIGTSLTDISGALRIDAAGKRDAGCWDILDWVQIVAQPGPVTGIAGETVTFTVKVTGAKEIRYQWNKIGGNANPVSTTDSYAIATTIADDSSQYYCVISNPINTVTTDTVLLRVYQKPAITDQPDTATVFIGDSTMFSVTATGGDLAYTWKRNGSVIPDANGPNYKVLDVSAGDSGALFVCVIVNKLDSVTSRTALLHVVSPVVKINWASADTMLTEGAELRLNVDVSGKLPLTYGWYKAGNQAILSSTNSFVKTGVTISDSGVYRCIVSNSESTDSALITIGIIRADKPNITYQSGPFVSIKTGVQVTLSVAATGMEPLTYTWYKGSYDAASSVASGMTYMITSASEDNSGNYFCVVGNSHGVDTSDIITLTVSSSKFFNPLALSCAFIDPTHAKITVLNFRDLPASSETSPFADTVGLWFNPLTVPSNLSSTDNNLIKLPLARMLAVAGNTFDTVIHLPEPGDECRDMHFILAPIWHNPDTVVSAVASMQYKKLYMCATTTLENNLGLTVVYNSVSDSIEVHIANLSSIDRDSLRSLEIEYTLGTRQPKKDTISSGDLPPDDNFTKPYHDVKFTESEETLTVSVSWRGILGNYSSKVTRKILVGKPRPANNAKLFCDSTSASDIYIHWQFEGPKDFDSIRILWGMQAITVYTNVDDEGIQFVTFSPSVTQASIDSLTSERQYYVGLQVVKQSAVSLLPASAVVICSTKISPLIMVPNSINLYDASFNADSNLFKLAWHIDTTQSGPADSLETGIVWAIDAAPNIVDKKNRNEILVVTENDDDNELSIAIKDSLRFMATYHFALLLRKKGGGSWTSATDSSCDTVQTGKPVWQHITYFKGDDSVAKAFNDIVVLKKAGDGVVYVNDTLTVFIPDSIDSGFKIVSSIGFDFKHDHASDPIVIELAYDTGLVGKSNVSMIRMYQYDATDKTWSVLSGSTIDSLQKRVSVELRPNSFKDPFILLIDTLPPTVRVVSDTVTAVEPSNPIRDTIEITDNIVNCSVKLVYWGQSGKGGNSVFVKQCTSKSSVVYTEIPSDSFSVDRGIKTELVVSDGVNDMVCDISRRVDRSSSDPMSLPAMKWAPVMTTAKLSHRNIEASLAALSSAKAWKYDSLYFRIFRWVDTSGSLPKKRSADISNWVEYQSDNSDLFDMVPGRVVWVKSRDSKNITLGKGVTVSMKTPCEIALKANDWNDIALPYNIDIRLGDLFTASASQGAIEDSILVYNWEKDEQTQTIVPSQKYIPEMPGYDSVGTTLTYAAKEGGIATYTVFNTTQRDITLSIPPIPEAFSIFAPKPAGNGAGKKKNVTAGNDVTAGNEGTTGNEGNRPWSIIVKARTDDGEMPPVLCAFKSGSGKRVYPVAPSFGRQRLLLKDPDHQSFCGSIIQDDAEQEGFAFPLLFENKADVPAQFSYTVTTIAELPRQWISVLNDPVTGSNVHTTGVPLSVAVTAETGVYKMLLVGDSTFIASWNSVFATRFSLLKMYPNPCRGAMTIRFALPFVDVKQVSVVIFDQLGRRVWNKVLHENALACGENTISWKPDVRKKLGAGTYIVQLSALASSGRHIGTLRQRILYIP